MTFLLFLFMLVNFADKIVVGLAGAPIMDELKLLAGTVRPARVLVLFPVFDLGHRRRLHRQSHRHRWVLLAMAVIWSWRNFRWSAPQLHHAVICRIILGAGEGPAFAVAAHAIYKWFPDEKRTLPMRFSRRVRRSA